MKFEELMKLPFEELLKQPNRVFWGILELKRRRAEKELKQKMFHENMMEMGYRYEEKNGVYYYWKEK